MIFKRIKAILSRNFGAQDQESREAVNNTVIDPFSDINARIQASDDISPAMKQLANRLVNNYVPSINLSYKSCIESSDVKAESIGRDITEIHSGISSHVTDCLLDIEKGADFEDRFGDVFLSNLLAFEAALESQNQKDCR